MKRFPETSRTGATVDVDVNMVKLYDNVPEVHYFIIIINISILFIITIIRIGCSAILQLVAVQKVDAHRSVRKL